MNSENIRVGLRNHGLSKSAITTSARLGEAFYASRMERGQSEIISSDFNYPITNEDLCARSVVETLGIVSDREIDCLEFRL